LYVVYVKISLHSKHHIVTVPTYTQSKYVCYFFFVCCYCCFIHLLSTVYVFILSV